MLHRHAFRQVDASDVLDLRRDYLETVTAPLDGMWEAGFLPLSTHWLIEVGGARAGYFCIEDSDRLLQFHVSDAHATEADRSFANLIERGLAARAIVGTNEPAYLAHCLDWHRSIAIHTHLYRDADAANAIATPPGNLAFRAATADDLADTIDFVQSAIDADEPWLEGYMTDLLSGTELFLLFDGSTCIATGECRPSARQPGVADLGMIVSRDRRGQGLAAVVLRLLKNVAHRRDLSPICSTTVGNVPARRAIARAGFVAYHRLLEIVFDTGNET